MFAVEGPPPKVGHRPVSLSTTYPELAAESLSFLLVWSELCAERFVADAP